MARIAGIQDQLHLHGGSLESYPSLFRIVERVQPDELYHLASQSFVSYSFEDPFSTFRSNIDGTHYVLEAVRQAAPDCRVYFAGSSEMFGLVNESPQTERTPLHPRSPYGISKVTGFHLSQNYREAYGMFAVTGILFNHEAGLRVRNAQDHQPRGPHQAGQGQRAAVGQSRCSARLGALA